MLIAGAAVFVAPVQVASRAPSPARAPRSNAGKPPAASSDAGTAHHSARTRGKPPERLHVGGRAATCRCGALRRRRPRRATSCDSLPFFEDALSKAVRDNPRLRPEIQRARHAELRADRGFSAQGAASVSRREAAGWRGKQARRAIALREARVRRPPTGRRSSISIAFYTIAVLATYVPPNAPPSAAGIGAAPHNPLATPKLRVGPLALSSAALEPTCSQGDRLRMGPAMGVRPTVGDPELGAVNQSTAATGNQYAASDQHGAGEMYAADGNRLASDGLPRLQFGLHVARASSCWLVARDQLYPANPRPNHA